MAIKIDPRMYSGGAVVFNSRPDINLYAQIAARQQAKKDALEQYYQKALTEVTPTGMRGKDVTGGWNQKLKDFQDFGIQNKKFLVNPQLDGYKALTEFNNRHADLMADVQKSKEAAAQEKDIYGLLKTGKWTPTGDLDQATGKFSPGSDLDIKERLSKSIYDPSRLDETGNEPDVSQFSINAPDLTGQQLLQYSKLSEGGLKRGKQKTNTQPFRNPTTGKVEQEYQDVFTPDQVKGMADNYGALVSSNKSLTKHYNNMLHSGDLDHLQRLNDAYKTIYPNGTMDTPGEVAKAEKVMLESQPSNIRTEAVADSDLAQQRKQANIRLAAGLNYGNWQSKERFTADAQAAGVNLQNVNADGLFNSAIQPDRTLKLDPTFLGNDPDVKNAINLRLSPDGKNVDYDINTYDKASGKVIETKTDSRPVAIVKKEMIHKLGLKDSKVPPPATAATNKKQYSYNGKIFTYEQIEKKAKQNGVTVDAYLKANPNIK